MNIHRPIFLLSILLRVARNAAKSALSSEPGNTIEAARAHEVLGFLDDGMRPRCFLGVFPSGVRMTRHHHVSSHQDDAAVTKMSGGAR